MNNGNGSNPYCQFFPSRRKADGPGLPTERSWKAFCGSCAREPVGRTCRIDIPALRLVGDGSSCGRKKMSGWRSGGPSSPRWTNANNSTGAKPLRMARSHRPKKGAGRGHTCPGGRCQGNQAGKGTKCMVVVDGQGVPLGIYLEAASPAEVTLLEPTLATIAVPRAGRGRPRQKPERLIADKAYASNPLRTRLKRCGIELIVPHRRGRKRPATQDGRKLRRYRKRWKVERTFS